MRARFFMLLSAVLACGCAGLQDFQYNRMQKHRADCAWRECFGGMNSSVSKDYRDGWKQGYIDLSRGQCDELPAVPPPKYWGAAYQTSEGRCCIEQWYSGWRDGADAAKASGTPEWHRIAPSPSAPSPAEHASLTQTAQAQGAGQPNVQMARRPQANLIQPSTQPSFKQAPPLPEEVDVAPPNVSTEDPEMQPSLSIRPVNGETSYEVNDAAVQENYAVPLSPEGPVGEGVENN